MWYVYGNNSFSGDHPMKAEKDGDGKWTTTSIWPTDAGYDGVVTWYASTAGTFYLNENNPYIDFTVEDLATNQKDLLVAKSSGTWSGTGGKLSFTFDHACTALRFYVKKSTNLSDYTLKVSRIVLKNVVNKGNYYYGTGEWTLDGRSDFTLLNLNTEMSLVTGSFTLLNGNETDSYLFMIPQTLTPWDPLNDIASVTDKCYLEIECEITKNNSPVYSGTAYIPFGAAFTAGNQHDVKINIGKNSLYSGTNTKVFNDN
jgi:hypothetical protein